MPLHNQNSFGFYKIAILVKAIEGAAADGWVQQSTMSCTRLIPGSGLPHNTII